MRTRARSRGVVRGTAVALAALAAAGCSLFGAPAPPAPVAVEGTEIPPTPDPRVGLAPGIQDAGQASWNMRLVSTTPPSEGFVGAINSDLAFSGDFAIQGSYNGYQVWNVANPARPALAARFLCPASQSDVSVYRHLLLVSGEGLAGRVDCGTQGVPDTVSAERLRGIRIVDVSDMAKPRYVANVQTCRGSHTHTVVTDPDDPDAFYIYVSGSAAVRSPSELPGCSALAPEQDTASSLFRIEVIRVPLEAPAEARIVSSPRIFQGLTAPPQHAEPGGQPRFGGAAAPAEARPGPTQCHDITAYPAIGRAGGACRGYGMLLDIGDAADPRRLAAVADSNFALWHSATFSNDGTKVLFTDEWGGGTQPKCRATDPYQWGANAIFRLADDRMEFASYYKMPAAQTATENCVAHNGSLIPIPGRDVMVQAWYQGGISVFDWTNPDRAFEIAFFDRGPIDEDRGSMAGSWSAYWYNGYVYSSEIARGLDVLELTTSPHLSQNELDAARSVRLEYFNAQEQPRFVWPPTFALARAYLDQLERAGGLASERIASTRAELARAEETTDERRRDALAELAAELEREAPAARDGARTRLLAAALRDLAAAPSDR